MSSQAALPASSTPFLFSRTIDLGVFGGSAALSVALLALGAPLGLLDSAAPPWTFLACVVAIDVAHVWASLFRVYLDPDERARRSGLYFGIPVVCGAVGWSVHSLSEALFWRCLAYFAVYHFIRQQLGFLALYQRRSRLLDWERWLEQAALLAAMLYPLIHWHAHLPQDFSWMIEGDFIVGLPTAVAHACAPLYVSLLVAYGLRQAWLLRAAAVHPGRCLLITTTALCWHLGILTFPSDYAFTVTNVIIHGVPYAALTYRYGRGRALAHAGGALTPLRHGALGLLYFLVVLWSLALLEELLWHHLVFQDQNALFGKPLAPNPNATWWTPLLAIPQLTHYSLDGFVWKRRANPEFLL